jgi:hypothetical protein
MKLSEIKLLCEMPTITISGNGEANVKIFASHKMVVNGVHGKRIKAYGPNNTEGTIAWGSRKPPEGNLKDSTIRTVQHFIDVYKELIEAVWEGIIDYDQFKSIYQLSKSKGMVIVPIEIQKIKDTKGSK